MWRVTYWATTEQGERLRFMKHCATRAVARAAAARLEAKGWEVESITKVEQEKLQRP